MYINIVETFFFTNISFIIYYSSSHPSLFNDFVIRIHFYVGIFLVLFHWLGFVTFFCSLFRIWYFPGLQVWLGDFVTANEETRKVGLVARFRRVFSLKYSNFHRSFQYIRCRCHWLDIKTTFSELKEIEQWRTQTITEREQKLSLTRELERLMQLFLITEFPTCWCSVLQLAANYLKRKLNESFLYKFLIFFSL